MGSARFTRYPEDMRACSIRQQNIQRKANHMEVLSESDLRQLVNYTGRPCVSLYLPTHRAGPETQQDPIRLKNLLRKAESGLQVSGFQAPEIAQLLRPARELLDNSDFWQHQSDGLAILTSPEMFRLYRVQLPVPELAVTSDRFHLKPLLAWTAARGHYYVLALSQNHVRVFRATRESIVELEGVDLPGSLTGSLRDRTAERQLQSHAVAASPGGRRTLLFHGHGGGEESKKEILLNYFQRVDEGMRDLLAQDRAPVVLAAVDYLNSIYRQANSSADLLDDWISGNPDNLAPRDLLEKADAIMSAFFTKDQAKAADQYLQLWYTRRASNTLAEILPAAYQGRVRSLFVALGVQQWGRFDESRNQTVIRRQPTPRDQDLLNLAAIQTFITGGSVYPVARYDVPGGGNVAAVFRY
jgi:Bacterial archaeo-eukaryotic release factor family 3